MAIVGLYKCFLFLYSSMILRVRGLVLANICCPQLDCSLRMPNILVDAGRPGLKISSASHGMADIQCSNVEHKRFKTRSEQCVPLEML